MVALAADTPTFNEQTLRQSMSTVAQRARLGDTTVEQAIAEGFQQGVAQAMADGIISARRRRNAYGPSGTTLALEDNAADSDAIWDLKQASGARLMMEDRLAATSVHDGDDHLRDLDEAMLEARLEPHQRQRILVQAWESAVEGTLEDGLFSFDEENALAKYAGHFGLTQQDLDGNGAQTSLVQAAVILDAAQGIVPQRQNIAGDGLFNLMKSDKLVWVIQDVDYLETEVPRERRGTSHGVSVRIARGVYYRPSTFRSRPTLWEETVLADTGLLDLTTKHIYFAGPRKKFQVRYDRIVAFEPYDDGFGIMRDAQTAKPQGLPDRRRVVRLQLGCQPGPDPSVSI